MRTIILLLCVLCTLCVKAQQGQNDLPAWAVLNDSMGHVLGLTNDQMKQVQRADETYRENAAANDPAAMEKRDKDLREVLMPSQFEQWKEIAQRRKASTK